MVIQKFHKKRFCLKFRKCDLTDFVGKVPSFTYQMNAIQKGRKF